MTNASDTPRVDSAKFRIMQVPSTLENSKGLPMDAVDATLARTLERELAAKSAEVKRLREALLTIEQWTDFPATGKFWDEAKTKPTSYAFEFGTYGERDYMRSIAREALEAK